MRKDILVKNRVRDLAHNSWIFCWKTVMQV